MTCLRLERLIIAECASMSCKKSPRALPPFGCVLLLCSAALANSAPVVLSVTASQRTDGSRKVDIHYHLADKDGDACTVSVLASDDGGISWTVPVTALAGDVGQGVSPGDNRLIIWDCKVDLPRVSENPYKVRLCADDGNFLPPQGMVFIPDGEFLMGDAFNEGEMELVRYILVLV